MDAEEQSPWSITSDQFSHLYSFYYDIVPEGELLSGSRAREFFLLSNLPSHQLHHIWTLSDIDRDGRLNPVEFAVAVHLTQLSLAGLPLPSSLPDELKVFFVSVLRHTLPAAKPHQLEKCRSAFTSFMENDKTGRTCISSTAAEYLLTNSKLSKGHLFHIWMLSDLDADGKLSFTEFAVAMQLVFVAKLNYWLPVSISPADILPEEFFSLARQVEAQAADLPPTNQPAPPSLPQFVHVGEDNPAISKVFKAIPAERFLNGKFEQFAANPFQQSPPPVANGHLPQLHQGEASPKSSHSSNTSSVRSLVEEREEPILQQAVSVDVVGSREVTPMPDEVEDELDQLAEASSKFLQETGGETDVSQSQGPTELEQRFVVDTEMQSAGSKGLPEIIRQISPDQTERNDTVSIVKQSQTSPTVTQTASALPESQAGKIENQTGQTENQAGETENDSATDDILAQLADLEAEVMDMLDDTNSFEPPPVPTPPEPQPVKEERKVVDEADTGRNIPAVVKTSPPSSTKSTSSSSSSPRRRTSSECSPEIKKYELNGSPRRKRSNTANKRKSQLLEDIDALLGDELANIESMEEAFKSKEEKRKGMEEREREELRQVELKVKENSREPEHHIESIEVMRQKRLEESKQIEQAWEEEMQKATAIARNRYEEQMSKVQLVENETIQGLEDEFATLLAHERESMKGAREIRAQRRKEEEERLEIMRKKMQEKKEVTIEEWIAMMEQNKLKEMTSEERETYEARKQVWLDKRKEKEERMRAEEEEKLRLAKERMSLEYRSYCQAEKEVKDSRLTAEQLQQLTEEQQQKEAEERKMRSEQARRRSTERKPKELDETKPKAKSALAARWEQSVKTRNPKDVRSTVLSGSQAKKSTISDREKERLAKHVG